jgi:hypothetical protein
MSVRPPLLTCWQGYREAGAAQAVNASAISLDHSNFKGFGNPGGFQFVNDE